MAICEKTGLEFEAATKRTKNHPSIMAVLNTASKDGWYREAMNFLEENKGKLETIEAFLEGLEQVRVVKDGQVLVQIRAEREAKEARQRVYTERREQNDFLNAHDYRWRKWVPDEEDADLLGAQVERYLTAPGGRVVSVKQAMLELAFQGLPYAKEWLKVRDIAEEIPEIEKERRAKEEQTKQEVAEIAALNTERQQYFQEAKSALEEAGLSADRADHEALRWSRPHSAMEDIVSLSPLALPDCQGMLVINGDFRYGVMVNSVWYGLEEIEEEYPLLLTDTSISVRFALYKKRNEARRAADLAAIEEASNGSH